MANITGKQLADFAISKIGTPYVYGAKGADGIFTRNKLNFLKSNYPKVFTPNYLNKIKKMDVVDKKVCCDCSGLISWITSKVYGSAQLYSKAYTRLPMKDLNKFAVGTVLWKSGHVGVYVGKDSEGRPLCVEAKGIDYGTVVGVIDKPNRWSNGLTFSWIDYDIKEVINDKTWKGTNPYKVPTKLLKIKDKGDDVRWLQWELIEAGYGKSFNYNGKIYKKVTTDGDFGPITESALKLFQKSCKIKVDGICGPITMKYLLNN